jgi:hypothetical protein
MPHLRYNGRFWRVSSDELFFPGMFAIFGRILWTTLLIVILAYSTQRLSRCPDGGGILAYLYLSLIVFVLSIFCEICLVKRSLVGSMVETEKRDEGIGKYLTTKIILGGIHLVLAIFGTFLISNRTFIPCAENFRGSQNFDLVFLAVIVVTQLVDVSSLFCCCYTFSASKEVEHFDQDYHLTATMWEGRCKSVMNCLQISTCNLFGGSNLDGDLSAVANVLTKFFHHNGFLDVVPSDVVAGIILVRIQQLEKESSISYFNHSINRSPQSVLAGLEIGSIDTRDIDLEESREDDEVGDMNRSESLVHSTVSVNTRKDLDKQNESDRALIEAAAKYAVHMVAVYTHFFALYLHPCTGLCGLCCLNICKKYSKTGFTSGSHVPYGVKGDNRCGMNHAGLNFLTKDIESDVVYASYNNDTVAKPFAVFLNHEQSSVVISIRGSMSLEDCITDAIAEPVEMKEAGDRWDFEGRDRYAHTGILKAAMNIREELESSKVLEKIFGTSSSSTPSSSPQKPVGHNPGNSTKYEGLQEIEEGLSASNVRFHLVKAHTAMRFCSSLFSSQCLIMFSRSFALLACYTTNRALFPVLSFYSSCPHFLPLSLCISPSLVICSSLIFLTLSF